MTGRPQTWREITHNPEATARVAAELSVSLVAAECYRMLRHHRKAWVMADRSGHPFEDIQAGLMELRKRGLIAHEIVRYTDGSQEIVWHHHGDGRLSKCPRDRRIRERESRKRIARAYDRAEREGALDEGLWVRSGALTTAGILAWEMVGHLGAPTAQQLAAALEESLDAVRALLEELLDAGAIRRHPARGGHPAYYSVTERRPCLDDGE